MSALTRSPWTTIGGILAALGSALTGIPLAIAGLNASSEAINFALPSGTVWLVIAGAVIAPVGAAMIGISARDNGTSSEKAGAK